MKIYQTDAEAAGTPRVDDTVGAGDLMYVDTDENGSIDANDMIRIFYTATPRLMYGLYNRQNEMCLKSKRNVPPSLLPWSKRNVRELVGFPNAL